jgi:hypothetical protein
LVAARSAAITADLPGPNLRFLVGGIAIIVPRPFPCGFSYPR